MTKNLALVVRHVAFEDLGVLSSLLTERGYAIRYLEAGVDRLDPETVLTSGLLVILGGPIGVYETDRYPFLTTELRAIAARLAQDRPTLGVCLGAQLMARALGADVRATGRVEIGYAPVTLTGEGQASMLAAVGTIPVLHWHGDEFAIPRDAARLALTSGFPNQAFSLGPRILGLQFHLEADYLKIERWLIGHAHELSARNIDLEGIRVDAMRYGPALARAAHAAFAEWLDQLDA